MLRSSTWGLNWKVILAFLDDILVLGRDFEGHLTNLRAVLVRLREYGLTLKPQNCKLFQKEIEFLGRVVEPRGMHIGPGYVKNIEDWPRPKNEKGGRQGKRPPNEKCSWGIPEASTTG